MKNLPERCLKEERVRNPYYDYGIGEEFEIKCSEYSHETGLDTWKHLNAKAFVFDMFGFVNLRRISLYVQVFIISSIENITHGTLYVD